MIPICLSMVGELDDVDDAVSLDAIDGLAQGGSVLTCVTESRPL